MLRKLTQECPWNDIGSPFCVGQVSSVAILKLCFNLFAFVKKEVFERTIVKYYTALRDFTGYSLQETNMYNYKRKIQARYEVI